MPKKKKTDIELPHILVDAVKEQRAVLVLGAGASMACRNAKGEHPPNGNQLRDHLASKFLGTKSETRDLATVAEMAIVSGAGQPLVFEEIAKLFSGFDPSDAHIKLADFRWRGLATTNYDTIIEQGYAANPSSKQTCLPFVKNTEPYDDRLKRETNPLPLFKLHGCINHRLDPDIPLVLSNEHYHRHRDNREHLFDRLQQWAQSSPVVFVGYQLADPHIRALVYDIDPKNRPQWYIVSPGADEHVIKLWANMGVDVIQGTFEQFVDALDGQVPDLFRSLSLPVDFADAPYRRFFRTDDVGSDQLRASLEADLLYIHSGVSFEEVQADKFYSGHDRGWCGIVRKFDFRRKVGENLLYSALDDSDTRQQRFLVLHGSAGSGKTIALRRAAYDAATALDELVLWLRPTGQPRAEVFEELFGLTGKHAVLFVDQVSNHGDAIGSLLRTLKRKNVPITIIASDREADWGNYCSELEEEFSPELHFLRRLNEREAEDLVDLLERHNCLGLLRAKSKPDRIAAFLDEDRANRQLLVALHELTQGKPFEKIILEEYDRITPDAARQLYLDIATMHQFGVVARAGAISRVSGIRFSDFEERFFGPLKDIVHVVSDPYTGDKGYETRHHRVSSILFGVACSDDAEKAAQLTRIINCLDVGFSSDKRVVESICKGRNISQEFNDIDSARSVFDAALTSLPDTAFLHQQAAMLEYLHRKGCLERAQELAELARSLDENNHIYIHTLAEVARRRANAATSKVASERLRAQSRSYLNSITLKDSRKDLSFCRLLVDEAIDLLRDMSEDPKDHELLEFDEKVADAVNRLRKAQQDFPNQAEFPTVEGQFWQTLGDDEKASRALEKAIKVKPKNSGAFARLSRIQRASGSESEATKTLDDALERFSGDKGIHLQAALLKIETGGDPSDIIYHFRSSFSPGDHNFEARYFLAEYLFFNGQATESKKLFEEIDSKAPDNFRKMAPSSGDPITERLSEFAGTISDKKDRYFFIQFGGYPSSVFAHMSALVDQSFDEIEVGTPVQFHLRFNRRGPVAVSVWTD
ncbi:SIR2 family protein [Paracoccus albus]|uniref:P-loop NTPase n=1 Tax=Paracoccus albus TaxID=3017784 RepID=UPI0022F00073|nr:SIR2 family protein [Paracoccus albus]WBU61183.1 SIR2 family protein [Paracoccus albus]